MIKKLNKPGRYRLPGHTPAPKHCRLALQTSIGSLMDKVIGVVCISKEAL